MSITFSGSSGVSQGSSNYGLVPNSSGFLNTPFQPAVMAFRLTGANAWEAFASATVYTFNSVSLNRGNCYNPSTGFFLCPRSGCYRISVSGLIGANGYYTYLWIYKNGYNISNNGLHVNTNTKSLWVTSHITGIVNCSVNDILYIVVQTTGGANIFSEHSQLSIDFIG